MLGHERGMTLDVDYLEALLKPVGSSTSFMCRLSPRNEMEIIKGFASNAHNFKKSDFFVRLDSASVAESCNPIFRCRWSRKGICQKIFLKRLTLYLFPLFCSD